MSLALSSIRRKALAAIHVKEKPKPIFQQPQLHHTIKPYMCENMNLNCILQALNNYEGSDRFKHLPKPAPHTVGDFRDLFNELTNNSYIFLKVIPAAMHLFGRNGWFAHIDCLDDNSIFVVRDTHIYNYIHFGGQWWVIDTQKKVCDVISVLQLGIGADYCLIPIRRTCAGDFMELLKRWTPTDSFYKALQAGLVVAIYEQIRSAPNMEEADIFEDTH